MMKYYCKNCGSEFKTGFAKIKCPYCTKMLGITPGEMLEVIPDYETPEQYEKRTGEAYPDNGAVWMYKGEYDYYPIEPATTATYRWTLMSFIGAKAFKRSYPMLSGQIVIADPPVPPSDGWRPK